MREERSVDTGRRIGHGGRVDGWISRGGCNIYMSNVKRVRASKEADQALETGIDRQRRMQRHKQRQDRQTRASTETAQATWIDAGEMVPFDRPPGSSMTSALTTVPQGLKKSFRSCHFT